ncbi:MAG: methyltransferase domain-containing protein [Candidatus Cryptobacteroides sp.]
MVHRRFARALGTYSGNASVQADTAAKLVEMLPERSWGRVFEVGCADGLLTRKLLGQKAFGGLSGHTFPHAIGKLYLNDLCGESAAYIADLLEAGAEFIPGDAETVPFPGNLDLLITSSTVQWMTDLRAFLAKCASSLAPGGVLALGTFGPENLKEVRAVTGEGLDYYDAESLKSLMPESLEMLACEQEIVVGRFPTPFDVLRHLKLTGVNSLSGRRWSKSSLEEFLTGYNSLFASPEGDVPLTFHPLRMVLAKK